MKRKFLAILTFMMILVFAMAFIACTDYSQPETPEETEAETVSYDQVVKNGTFYDVTSTDKDGVFDSVSNWTVTAAGLAVPTGGKNSADGIFAAALDLTGTKIDSVLNEYKIVSQETAAEDGSYPDLGTPIVFEKPAVDPATPLTDKRDENGKVIEGEGAEKVNQDNNAFLFASTNTSSSIYLKSASITLTKNSVYKFQFSVASKVEKETSGAFVFIRGDMEKEYVAINTDGAWKTEELYIETNKDTDMTITVELWLGYGPKKSTSTSYASDGNDKYATRGFALFDNVILTKLVETVENEEKEAAFPEYDSEKTLHENFVAFSENKANTYTAYYLKAADFANRTHLSSSSYFGDSSTYRKYFYEVRDYSSANTSSSYWTKTSDFSAESNYYGIVNPSVLYKSEDKVNYSSMTYTDKDKKSQSYFMSYGDWNDKVLNGNRAFNELKEQYVLMIYNNALGASGFYSSDTNAVTIESNKYYEISVWTYVWTTTYKGSDSFNGEDSILPAYKFTSGAITNPTAPTDPRTSATAVKKNVYKLYTDYSAENSASVLAGNVKYFEALTSEQKNAFNDFSTSSFITSFQQKKNEVSNETYYNEMIASVKSWLKNTLGIADPDTTTAESFLYTYLYFNYMNDTAALGSESVEYPEAQLTEWGFLNTEGSSTIPWLTRAYLQERNNNIGYKDTMVTDVKKYETEYAEYQKKHNEYEKAEQAYVTECQNWLNENTNGPHATLRISGAGEDISEVSTVVNGWEKITLYVRGNQLSSRTVTLNLLFGENKNDSDKMIGGVFFDNVEIAEIAYDNTKTWHSLSEITTSNEISFGGLTSENNVEAVSNVLFDEGNPLWKAEKLENTAENDNEKIDLSVAEDESLHPIDIDGEGSYNSYKLVYKHSEATASTLIYDNDNGLITIKPNKYYRIAFQVKTKDLEDTTGLSISLLKKVDGEFADFDTSVTGYVSDDDWTEIVYYIRGDRNDTYELSFKFGMGSGTRFAKDSYIEGETWIASFNCLEITEDEYSSAKTGDKIIKGLSLSSTSYTIDSGIVTNASYSAIDYDKADEDLFDDNGIKEGSIVPASSWTEGKVYTNVFDTPTLTLNDSKLTWVAVEGYNNAETPIPCDRYELWVKYKDNNKDKTIILDVVSGATEYDLAGIAGYENWIECSVALKAVSTEAVSPLSSFVDVGGNGEKNVTPTTREGVKAYEEKAGAKKITDDFDGCEYKSPYDSVYTIRSDYNAAVAVASDSTSLSANKFYKISVWVKTDPNTYAGVTLTGTDGSVDAILTKEGAIGFSKITTNGVWKEYVIYVKTGNFSVSPKINLCLGNPLADVHKMNQNENDAKNYYNVSDLSSGSVYFDAVRVMEVKESEYQDAKDAIDLAEDKTSVQLSADNKLLYKNSETYIYSIQYTLDSFDTWTEKSSDADKYGNEPNNYTHSNGDNVTDSSYSNLTYGIYNANSSNENMKTALSYLYSNGSENLLFNKYFSFASDYTDADWSAYLKEFLNVKDENGKSGGDNVLVMSNKIATGSAQTYTLGTSYKYSIAAEGYYKLTFTAKTLIAKPVYSKVVEMPQEDKDAWSTAKSKYYIKSASTYTLAGDSYADGTDYYTISWTMEDCYAQMRFESGESGADPLKVYISSYDKDDAFFGSKTEKTYTVYIYNPSSASNSSSWNFRLGDGNEKNNNEYTNLLVGMVAVDLISVEAIDKDAYQAGISTGTDSDGEFDEKSPVQKYVYTVSKDSTSDTDGETDTEPEPEKTDFWTNLVNDQYFWLYISSFVLGIVIIVVVIVVLVRRFKEKHPKKVVGENIVKTEKDIQVVEPEAQEKEEALEADEYVDEIKPIVQQRVLPKKNRKKKKK